MHNSKDSSEEAEVEEITTGDGQIGAEMTETTAEATTKNDQQSSTTSIEESCTENPSEENQTAASVGESSVTSQISSTTTDENTSGSVATEGSTNPTVVSTTTKPDEAGKEPGYAHSYYGGSPLENADLIFITTTEEAALADNGFRNEFKPEFRPSVQYEFLNYKVHPELHFVPMVGQNLV